MSKAAGARRFHHVAVLMGGLSAEREVSLNSGKACAAALETAGYKVTLHRCRPRSRRPAPLGEARGLLQCFARPLGRGRLRAGSARVARLPYTHSGVLASALAMHKERAKEVMRAAGVPVAEGRVVARAEAAKSHVLPRPYVLKPVTEGSSVGVFIVREDHTHPPQELNDPGWAYRRIPSGRALHPRSRADLRGDGRPHPRRHRNRAGSIAWLLQLRVQVRRGRLAPHRPGADFIECLRIGAEVNFNGPQGIGLPGRFACGLPLRRHRRRIRRRVLPGGQHAARHDGNLAGAGAGRSTRASRLQTW